MNKYYITSYLGTITISATVHLIFSLAGVAAFIVIEVLGSPALDLKHVADLLEWMFMVIPHYACSSSIRSTYKVYVQSALCKFKCEDSNLPFKECMEEVCKLIPKCCSTYIFYKTFSRYIFRFVQVK